MTAQKATADTPQPERTENIPYLSATAAAKLAGVVLTTVSNWARRHPELGVKVMGRWRINAAQLQRILNGERPNRAGK